MQRVNPLALEWARPLTRMRAPSHGRTSGYLAKRGPGLSPCFGDRPRRAVQPLAHHPQNARLLPTGQGVRLRSASACHPLRGGFGPTPPGILLLPETGEEECKTPAIRRSTGLSCAEAALRTAGRTSGSVVPPPACPQGSCNTRSRRCLRCRLAMGCLAAGESPDPRFHPSAFSVGMDPRGSRALAHTPGRLDPSGGNNSAGAKSLSLWVLQHPEAGCRRALICSCCFCYYF